MISGRGERRLQLRNWPVISMNSLAVDGITIPASTGPTNYGWFLEPVYGGLAGKPQNLAIIGGVAVGGGVVLSGSNVTFAPSHNRGFPRGYGNIAVNYSFGYTTLNEQQTIPSTVLLDQNGQPILDQSGNPIVDQAAPFQPGQPILDQNGNAILDQSGNPLIDQGFTITTPLVFPAQSYGPWSNDLGVFYQTAQENNALEDQQGGGLFDQTDNPLLDQGNNSIAAAGGPLTAVKSNPQKGQYVSPNLNGDNPTLCYQFSPADAGQGIYLNYDFVPYDVEQACIEVAAERYRYRSRIGQASQSLGGQETASYLVKDALTAAIKQRLDPYRIESFL
jgi:hypothetical protein